MAPTLIFLGHGSHPHLPLTPHHLPQRCFVIFYFFEPVFNLGLGSSPNTLSPNIELMWTDLARAAMEAAMSLVWVLPSGSGLACSPSPPPIFMTLAVSGMPTGREAAISSFLPPAPLLLQGMWIPSSASESSLSSSE